MTNARIDNFEYIAWGDYIVDRKTFLELLKVEKHLCFLLSVNRGEDVDLGLKVDYVRGGDRQSDHYVADRSHWDPEHFYMLYGVYRFEDLPF